jgi:hypothetical protein
VIVNAGFAFVPVGSERPVLVELKGEAGLPYCT